jgi:MFS family permease
MRISPRIFAVGFLQNVAGFLAWTVIPVWAATEARATFWEMGMLPTFTGVTYIFTALRAGRLSDRVSRAALARTGMLIFAGFCGLAWWARSVLPIALLGIVNGFGMALIWPALQAHIADHSNADDLERNLGSFSLSWSAGKTAGFLLFPFVYGGLGLGFDALLPCGALALLLVLLVPPGRVERPAGGPPLVRDDHHPPALRAGFLRAGWLSNLAAYGMGSTVVYLYPKLLVDEGRPAWHHAWLTGAIYLSQTVSFWFLGRFSGWRYRIAPLMIWMAAGAGALLAIGLGLPHPWSLLPAAVLGVALGQAYSASVYYSVHSEQERGARAGIHEAVIGASDFGIPLLGSLAAQQTGRTAAPYVVAVAVAGVALVCADRAAARGRTTSASA